MPCGTQQGERCIGCNACVEAFHGWRMSKKDGRCSLIGGKEKRGFYSVIVDDPELDNNLQAARNCTVNSIKIQT